MSGPVRRPQHVSIAASGQQPPFPGLLIEWRRVVDAWEGLCLWVSTDSPHGGYPHVHVSWIEADRIVRHPAP